MRSVCLGGGSLAALLESVCRVPVWQTSGAEARRREAGGNWPGNGCRLSQLASVGRVSVAQRRRRVELQAGEKRVRDGTASREAADSWGGRVSARSKQHAARKSEQAGAVQCSADTEDEALALALAIDPVSEGRWRRRGGERGGRTQEVGMGCGAVVQWCSGAAVQQCSGAAFFWARDPHRRERRRTEGGFSGQSGGLRERVLRLGQQLLGRGRDKIGWCLPALGRERELSCSFAGSLGRGELCRTPAGPLGCSCCLRKKNRIIEKSKDGRVCVSPVC